MTSSSLLGLKVDSCKEISAKWTQAVSGIFLTKLTDSIFHVDNYYISYTFTYIYIYVCVGCSKNSHPHSVRRVELNIFVMASHYYIL